jgi:hypothetical protein
MPDRWEVAASSAGVFEPWRVSRHQSSTWELSSTSLFQARCRLRASVGWRAVSKSELTISIYREALVVQGVVGGRRLGIFFEVRAAKGCHAPIHRPVWSFPIRQETHERTARRLVPPSGGVSGLGWRSLVCVLLDSHAGLTQYFRKLDPNDKCSLTAPASLLAEETI